MPKKTRTLHAVVLDRSGSMASLWTEAVGGLKTYAQELPKSDRLTLAVFDDRYDILLKEGKPREIDLEGILSKIKPRGSTALRDAWGKTLGAIEPKGRAVAVVVVTDGYENASTEVSPNALRNMIAAAEAKGWKHVYLAANQVAEDVAVASFGLSANSAATFSPTGTGVRSAFRGATRSVRGDNSWKGAVE